MARSASAWSQDEIDHMVQETVKFQRVLGRKWLHNGCKVCHVFCGWRKSWEQTGVGNCHIVVSASGEDLKALFFLRRGHTSQLRRLREALRSAGGKLGKLGRGVRQTALPTVAAADCTSRADSKCGKLPRLSTSQPQH